MGCRGLGISGSEEGSVFYAEISVAILVDLSPGERAFGLEIEIDLQAL